MIRFKHPALFASALIALVACQSEPANELPEAAAPGNQPRATGMGSQGSMTSPGAYAGSYMMGDMTTYMRSMDGIPTDSLQAMMPRYGERVDSMLVQMNRDMSARNMPADPRWNATADSIGSDVTRMLNMSAVERQTFMPGHRARVMWMMETHRTMMSGAGV